MKIVVFTGAGVSAESGIKTFRGDDGLWEGHRVEDVATYDAWCRAPARVLEFYNMRREAIACAKPNAAHSALAELEKHFDVEIITQNIDDLHERAGSSKVLHLHGEIFKSQSSVDSQLVYPIAGTRLDIGDTCELGSQLRPFIVWFGEAVPAMERAVEITRKADVFLVVGSSLLVYPAASLLDFVQATAHTVVIDPVVPANISASPRLTILQEKASSGVAKFIRTLCRE